MAIEFTEERETSEGPLDVAKSAGSDLDSVYPGGKTLDGDQPGALEDPYSNTCDTEAERLRQKNPLGYTITPATTAEIEHEEDARVPTGAPR